MSQFVDLFGEKLLNKDGDVDTATALDGKQAIGLYFSASWCPPCQQFTPKLVKNYKELKQAGKDFEIVFVGCDKEEVKFKEYFAEMPWLALPFPNNKNGKVSQKFKCKGIPYLVIIDGKTTEILTTNGKSAITSPDFIKDFPYKPIKLSELDNWYTYLFGQQLNHKGTMVKTAPSLKGLDYVMVYFGANWHTPCKGFTPKLIGSYKKLKEASKNFEIIFASSDKTKDAFDEFYNEMPWLAVPYGDPKLRDKLSRFYDIKELPKLVIIHAKTGETVTTDGKNEIICEGFIDNYPYLSKDVYDVAENMNGVNDGPVLILVQDYVEKEIKNTNTAVLTAAVKVKPNFKNKVTKFFTGNGGGPLTMIKMDLEFEEGPPKIHEHPLELRLDEQPNWNCDGCGKPGYIAAEKHFCIKCNFAHCETCTEASKHEIPQQLKFATMVIVDMRCKKYYKREGISATLSMEHLMSMLKDFSEGRIEARDFKIGGK